MAFASQGRIRTNYVNLVRALYGNCGTWSSSAWPGKDTHDARSSPDAIALANTIKRGAGEEAGATSSRLRGHREACRLFSDIRQHFVKNRPQTTRLEHRLTRPCCRPGDVPSGDLWLEELVARSSSLFHSPCVGPGGPSVTVPTPGTESTDSGTNLHPLGSRANTSVARTSGGPPRPPSGLSALASLGVHDRHAE